MENIARRKMQLQISCATSLLQTSPRSVWRILWQVTFILSSLHQCSRQKQITLIEIAHFSAIKRAEFLSLKWNGRDKKKYAPNIVESTRWFNQLNFWVQKEILKYSAVQKRTDMLSFFIKLAKRLVEVNNLYSAMSIVSALQVECIYRLKATWSGLGHRERIAYRRLEELFGQHDNCRLLREHTASMRLPGIPYLGKSN